MAKRLTEEEAGVSITDDEKAILNAPPAAAPADDYPEGGNPDPVEIEAEPAKAEPAKVEPQKTEPAKLEKPPAGYVDQRALQEARAEKKLLEERMNVLLEVVNRTTKPAEQKVEAPAKPVLLEQPMEFIGDVADRLAKIEGSQAEQEAAREAEKAEQRDLEAALAVAQPQFVAAAEADATITPTYSALLDSLAREIAWQNHIPLDSTATPAQRQFLQKSLTDLENAHIKYAVSTGQNVVDYMKGFAASRGVVAQAVVAQQQPEPKTIAQRQQAQQRHQSLSDARGSEVPAKLSAKDIAKMDPKQFAAFAKKVGDAGLDEIMGASGNA